MKKFPGTRLFLFILAAIMQALPLKASDIEMADQMRSDGMIYVVIAVLCIVFTGIVVFLLMIERRLRKLEKGKD